MPEQAKKLVHFTNAVIREAQIEAGQSMRVLEKRRASALAAAREQARAEVQDYLKTQTAHIQANAGREVSRHLMDCKREIYLRRSEIAAEVFEKVVQRLRALTASPEYPSLLERRLAAAIDQFGPVSQVTVYLRSEDMHLAPVLEQAVRPVAVQFQEGGFSLGGVTVDCPETGRCVDGAYDTALADLSGHFAELFGLSLSDDLAGT